MLARIYQPGRNIMQSGRGKTQDWVLEFEPSQAKQIDPLMGWTGSGDMNGQVRLRFDSKQAAIDYARKHDIPAQVIEPAARQLTNRPRGYGANFAHDRRGSWTH